ncbi:MAG: hypothetical protein PF501_12400 [Salinisphaera sp.]|jgi:hypothetical protein|nr:hypothetical protein [Salinisphaera sp.]
MAARLTKEAHIATAKQAIVRRAGIAIDLDFPVFILVNQKLVPKEN